ncbi:MAG: hypothetical protein ACRCZK_03940 [Oscillospiraceae bacterium]
MMYKPIYTLKDLQSYLNNAPLVAFDFETAPNDPYRTEEKSALDAHKSHIVGISFSIAEGIGVYVPKNDMAAEKRIREHMAVDRHKTTSQISDAEHQ